MKIRPLPVISLALAALSVDLKAAAQSATAPGAEALEEIIVTAQRRQERLQDVPISLSVYTQAAMDTQGVRAIDDIARLTPGVTFARGSDQNSESSNISIRGISSTAGAATTGIYLDDTPIQSRHLAYDTFNAYPALFDIDHVEVLRGPQGTLFGAGSEGGTIRFILPQPNLREDSAYVRSELGFTKGGDPTYEIGAAYGAPIVQDSFAFRASVSYRSEGGYVDHVDWHNQTTINARSNWDQTLTARVALRWQVSDALTISPSVYYQRYYLADTSAYWAPGPGADPALAFLADGFKNGNARPNSSNDSFYVPALKVDLNLGDVRVASNTSYFSRDQTATLDFTQFDRAVFIGNPFPPVGSVAPTATADIQDIFTQEVRVESTEEQARVKWTAGIFYQRARENTIEDVYDPNLPGDFDAGLGLPPGSFVSIFGPTLNGYVYRQDPFRGIDEQVAAFGQAEVKLIDALTLSVGLRVAKTDFNVDAAYAGPAVGPSISSNGSISEKPVTPKVGLTYKLSPENMIYALAAKGYRVGGANAAVGIPCGPSLAAIGLSSAPPTYNSDSVWSYEVGSKNSFADRKVFVNASAYLIKWRNIQQNVALSACGFQFVDNLGAAESKGLDLETEFRPLTNLSFGGTFGLTDASYTQTVLLPRATSSLVQDGDHLSGSPWTLNAWGQYGFQVVGQSGYARFDYQYNAKQTDHVPNQDPLNGGYAKWYSGVPAQSYMTVRFGVRTQRFDVSLYAQNLFNTHPKLVQSQDVGSPAGGSPLFYDITWRPLTVGLTGTYRY